MPLLRDFMIILNFFQDELLFEAASAGKKEDVEKAVKGGADINYTSSSVSYCVHAPLHALNWASLYFRNIEAWYILTQKQSATFTQN